MTIRNESGNEVIEAEPFEGVVHLSPVAFGELYLAMMGLTKQTPDLGMDSNVTVRGSYKDDTHTPHLVFSDYRNRRRTIVAFFPPKNAFIKAVFETIKNRVPVLRFSHEERRGNDVVSVLTEYDKTTKTVKMTTVKGEVKIEDKQIPFIKFLLEQILVEGIPLTRTFDLRGFRLFPDGAMKVAGTFVGNEKVKTFLGGNEVELPAYPAKLLRVLS